MTALDVLVRFEDEALTGLSPLTVSGLQGVLLRFGRWLAPRDLLDATTGDITAWFDELGLAAKTRADRVSQLHRFYSWALGDGLVDRDPAAPLSRMKHPLTAGDFPETLRGWFVAQERRNLSRATIDARCRELRWLHDWLAPKSVLDATAADIEAWLDSKRLTPKARYRAISNLHVFYEWARREGLTGEDPTATIDRPRLPVGVPRPIRTADLTVALGKADPTVRAMLALAAFCGLRAKEIAGLRREDVLDHLEPPMLVVTAPKGRRERTVPLHASALDALEQAGMPRSGYVFAWPNGRPFPAWKVSQMANNHLQGLQIASSLHKLRHWYATNVYASSLDLRLTQELLGHSSPTTTAVYTAYSQSKAAGVVASLSLAG